MVRRNLADPDYEPTDEELIELAHSAFKDVPAQNAAALRKVYEEIAAIRASAVRGVARPQEPRK